MADFTFVRALNGMTPQTELRTAGGAMEVGDLVVAGGDALAGVASTVDKAANSALRGTIMGLCLGKSQEDGSAIADGDLVQILPLTGDVLLEGVAKDASLVNVNAEVGLDVTADVQTFEGAETNAIGRIYKVVDATAKIVQVIMYPNSFVVEIAT